MNEPQKLLVEALRSGEYKQTNGALHVEGPDGEHRYCCLGVACELYMKQADDFESQRDGNAYSYRPKTAPYQQDKYKLPEKVKNWLGYADYYGMITLTGELRELMQTFPAFEGKDMSKWTTTSLANLNDNGVTFEEIAKIIELGGVNQAVINE